MINKSEIHISSTRIIGLSLLIILIVGGLIFFFTIQIAYQIFGIGTFPLQESFFSQLDPDTDKIFILGSSHVNAIDPNIIQEQLSNLRYNFDVYNLSIGGYSIDVRSKTIDFTIDAKPKIILYGIAGDDFANTPRAVNIKFEKPESIFPDPQKSFSLLLTNSFLEKYDFLQSPRFFLMAAMYQIFNTFMPGDIAILSETFQESKMPFFHICCQLYYL